MAAHFGVEWIARFNGGLFESIDPVPLTAAELTTLRDAAELDWGAVEPAIFGTLFERSPRPEQTGQLGAHYTGGHDIERVVEPVVMTPSGADGTGPRPGGRARAGWETADTAAPATTGARRSGQAARIPSRNRPTSASSTPPAAPATSSTSRSRNSSTSKRKSSSTAQQRAALGLPARRSPTASGLEINEYARELAQVVIWIAATSNGDRQRLRVCQTRSSNRWRRSGCKTRCSTTATGRPEGGGVAGSGLHHWQPAILGRKQAS